MKQILVTALAILAISTFQSCKKSADTPATAAPQLEALINGTSWAPDTLSAGITYYAATKTKVFNFTGTYKQRLLNCAITVSNAANTNDFTLTTYVVDATGNPLMTYSAQQKDSNGNYVFMPVATAAANNGTITISSINVASGLISGTFSFSDKKNNYDNNGNVVSITNTVISSGEFTNMPYKFISE